MEFLDIVDKDDKVIGKAPRNEIYEKKLMHRIVHILLFNQEGKMALQLRSEECSFCPLHWSTAVGGHVSSGESYEKAALREYKEELGTTSDITLLYKDFYDDARGLAKFLSTFKAIYEGEFKLESKVLKVEYFTIDEIKEMIEKGEKFHPELLFLLKKHFLN